MVGEELLKAIEASLQFDFLQHRNSPPTSLAGITRRYMEECFYSRILVQRRIVKLLYSLLETGQPIILVGAPGGGKTAALLALNDFLQSQEPVLWHLVRFNGNVNRSSLRERHTPEAKASYILGKIADRIYTRLIMRDKDTELAWRLYLVRRLAEFGPFRDVFGSPEDASALTTLIRSNGTAAQEYLAALREFRNAPVSDQLGPRLGFLHAANINIVVAIDNCDQLSDLDLRAAKAAAVDLHSRTDGTLPVIVAVRPPSRRRVKRHMDYAAVREVYLNAFESTEFLDVETPDPARLSIADLRADLSHAFEIFNRRLALFHDPDLLAAFQRNIDERFGDRAPSLAIPRQEVDRLSQFAQRVLMDYFDFDGTQVARIGSSGARRHTREDLTRVFIMWHNGSLRELGESFYHYMRRFEEVHGFPERLTEAAVGGRPRQTIQPKPYELQQGGDVRTVLFRHLLFHATSPVEDSVDGIPGVHGSFRLFSPAYLGTRADFTFPRARVLQYLAARIKEPKQVFVAELRQGFSVFGIAEPECDSAIQSLWERDGYATGLLRVNGVDRSPEDEFDDEQLQISGSSTIELLPAGLVLVDRLAYVVEFLYWSCTTDSTARETVQRALRISKTKLVSPRFFSLATNRVEVALSYVADVMLDRYSREHPYMSPGRIPTQPEAKRLRDFCRLFGFGPSDWYLNRALNQIQRYASDIDPVTGELVYTMDLSKGAFARMKRIEAAAEQLDSVFYHPTDA